MLLVNMILFEMMEASSKGYHGKWYDFFGNYFEEQSRDQVPREYKFKHFRYRIYIGTTRLPG